ncbi:MAG: non-ribosomal peptide synthase/polyketide synthase [Pedobacter sp.]
MSDTHFPLHPAQQEVYTDQFLNMDSPLYNIGGYIVLRGKLDKAKFYETINSAPAVFDCFKLRFKLDKPDYLCHYEEDYTTYNLSELDFSKKENSEEEAKIWAQSRFNTPLLLNLDTPPFEQYLLKISDNEHWFFGKYHHLITDGYGFVVWIQYISKKYQSLIAENNLEFSYPSYKDEAIKATQYLHSSDFKTDASYWKERILNKPEKLLQKKRFHLNNLNGSTSIYKFILTNDKRQLLEELQLNTKASLQQLTLAALLIYFGKTTGEDEFVFGVPIHKRGSRVLRNIVGMFSGILPFKGRFQKQRILKDFLTEISGIQKTDYRHQNYPIGEISRHLKVNNSDGYFYDVVVNYEPLNFELNFNEQLQSSIVRLANEDERTPLQLAWRDYGTQQALELQVHFSQEYFSAEEAELFTKRIIYIIEQFSEKLNDTIGSIQILPSKELALLSSYNSPAYPYSSNETLVDLIEQQIERTPYKIAVLNEEAQISYAELNERSNQLAHYLQSKGVTAETLVPVCLDRNINMLIGILGILKSGAAYVPIDPEYPKERISYMLEDTHATLIISSVYSRASLPDCKGVTVIELDGINQIKIANQPTSNLKGTTRPHTLAYVVYTSGSTGIPKGVMIEHSNAFSFLNWCRREFSGSIFETVYATTSICFDLSVFELFYPLTVGKTLRILENGLEIGKYLSKDPSVLINTVPSVVDSLLNERIALNLASVINMAGEPVPLNILQKIDTEKTEIRNLYGPTEDTTYSTVYRLKKNAPILIGKPISNTYIYILSQDKELCPIGVSGEIYIGGSGLARGYLNQLELTDKNFLADPFSPEAGPKIYKTGDLGRWLPDGNIEYLNRIDYQVKIRGFRIEPGEIENVLMQNSAVKQAVVLAKEDITGNMRLIAYIVPGDKLDKEAIQNYLQKKVPHYMVPALWVEMEHFPLTLNGKIDRKALPNPEETDLLHAQYTAPRNDLEKALSVIWQQVLQIEQVGVHDNFFALGGHSLLGMQVVSAIRQELALELPIKSLFIHPTIAGLAAQLGQQQEQHLLPIKPLQHNVGSIPLSFSQERLWFIDQLEGSVQYHLPAVLRLRGKLSVSALESAFKAIVERHEILRTVVLEKEGLGYQGIISAQTWGMSKLDGKAYVENEALLQAYIQKQILMPFDLSSDYMLRAELVSLGKEEYILIVTMHHIASDAWSMSIIVKEVAELYNIYKQNRPSSLSPLPLQYADYSVWQRENLQGALLEQKLNYWKTKLSGLKPLELPLDYRRPIVRNMHGATVGFSIDKDFTEQLQSFSQKQNVTLFMTLLSAFKVLLHRYSGQEDICVGTPIANRTLRETENMVGFFVNTLALRSDLGGDPTFKNLLQNIRDIALEAYKYQDAPFEKVVEAVVKDRDQSRSPLFQVMLVLQNTPYIPKLDLGEVKLTSEEFANTTSKFDLTFTLTTTVLGLECYVEYNTDLYRKETIERMIGHYTTLLHSILNNPDQQISSLTLLGDSEKNQLLNEFSGYPAQFPTDETIVSLFYKQVIINPHALALVFEDKEMTYRQLNERSNQLARYLQIKGVKAETLVAICLERGLDMIIGILGILKAGGAYVPIDPEYPQERINFMLEDTKANLLITSLECRGKITDHEGITLIELDGKDQEKIDRHELTNLPDVSFPRNLAYVIYTSGSTGKPKGVMIEHGGVVNLTYTQIKPLELHTGISVFQFASFSFDASCYEIFCTLLSGGKLVLARKETLLDVKALGNILKKHQIELITLPPSYQSMLRDDIFSVKTIVSAGEILNTGHVTALQKKGVKVINAYGPTENTVCAVLSENPIDEHGRISIGKPLSNVSVYIVDKVGQLLPIGVAGELWIGGVQVGRGYLNRPELSAEKFISNPFSLEGGRLYKTGDLCRWLPDGNIEFLGRIDHQVKIRGYRIELGEIESVLQEHPSVSQAVVLARKDAQGNNRLVGYTVPAEGSTFDKVEIQTYLSSRLPDYMIPQLWVELRELPLTSSGKADRKALPDPDVSDQLKDQYVAPVTESQISLARIWQQLLNVDQVGIHDNFFELGGHSLLAMRVISTVRRELDQELSIKSLFQYPTIALLSKHLEEQEQESVLPAIIVGPRPSLIPLSYSQERLWFIDQLGGSVHYHLPSVLRLSGKLDKGALSQSLASIIERHEVLRTVIREEEGQAYQNIRPGRQWSLRELAAPSWKEEELTSHISGEISLPFDLSKDYMLRALLISQAEEDHLLVVTIHHIASDAWSSSILVREMIELYSSYQEGRKPNLPTLPLQYADYSLWQRAYLQGEILASKLSYWKSKLDGLSVLQLPTDYVRPAVQSTRGDSFAFSIDQNLSASLQALSQAEGVTLYMTLLAAFKILLYRYSGQEDICVGSPVAGRSHHEIEGLIGFFVNTLALRTELSGDSSFTTVLQSVKETTLEAYNHQEVPFEKVVEAVVRERDPSRSPLFQVMLVLQNTPDVPELRLGEVSLSPKVFSQDISKFEMSFNMIETNNGLQGSVEYNTDLYSQQTIQRMTTHFANLLDSIIRFPSGEIRSFDLLSGSERSMLLEEFQGPKSSYPIDKTITDLFEKQVLESPDAIAVAFEDTQLTYNSLNIRANQLAHYLLSKGAARGQLIPICIERSTEMIVGILGILKAGCAYVPIDPDYPQERINYMLEDTQASLVLSSRSTKWKLSQLKDEEIIDLRTIDLKDQPELNPDTGLSSSDLAYVIYTSGSTGKPKGTMNEHRGIVNRLAWAQDYFRLSSEDSILQKTTYSFDVSVWELLWPLLAGARLVFAKPGGHKDNEYLKDIINREKITMLHFVPSMLSAFLTEFQEGECPGLKRVLCSGEVLSPAQAALFKEKLPSSELHNLYGPTEAAIDVTYWSMPAEAEDVSIVPIGKPLSNVSVYIVDKVGQLVPIGVPGELWIGGVQVGRGYLNRPELSAEKFISNPFSLEGGRLYKTGDLCRWLPDGNIEFLGRIDHQVKIRGYRIELGEIESVLQEHPSVSQAVVLARKDAQGNNRLVGYTVPAEGSTFDKVEIQTYLSSRLPDYMIPQLWVELRELPLTSSGKADRKALPDPDVSDQLKDQYVAPVTESQIALARIWQQLLNVDQIGIHDNFFELGGDSILTIQVISRMRSAGYELQPKDIFTRQTISRLSKLLSIGSAATISGEEGVLKGSAKLLPIQRWYLEQSQDPISYFNQSVLLQIDKSITTPILIDAFQQLLDHHDALRFVYTKVENEWYQEYGKGQLELVTENLQLIDMDSLPNRILECADRIQQSLDITTGRLIGILWIQTPSVESHNRLLIVIHHLAIDGVSWRIVLEDLQRLLAGIKNKQSVNLGPKSSSYRQWYEALELYGKSESILAQETYWSKILKNYKPLITDKLYERKVQVKNLSQVMRSLDTDQTRLLLQEVPRVYHTEVNDILLAALAQTLCEWQNTKAIVIGLEGHGREQISEKVDISRSVGWFTSLYPVLLQTGAVQEDGDLIKTIKELLRQVPDKGVGYGVLRYITGKSALQETDPWDIIFNYLGQLDTTLSEDSVLQSSIESSGSSQSDLHLVREKLFVSSSVQEGQLVLQWRYSTLHYHTSTIESLIENYQKNLQSLISHCIDQGKKSVVYTPSDYGLGTVITYQELDRFLEEPVNGKKREAQIAGLYGLSGLQQGMLFHGLYDGRAGSYVEQLSCDVIGVKDPKVIFNSWNDLLARHSILRSSFHYDEFAVPIQCVYREATLPITELDYRNISSSEQLIALEEYQLADRARGFDFKDAPLMRLAFIRLSADRYRMLLTYHHILFDGWSLPILLEEFLNTYDLLSSGIEALRFEEDRYEDYIRYIESRDKFAAELYWKKYLQRVEQPTLLPFIGATLERTKGAGVYKAEHLRFGFKQTSRISDYAHTHHLTLNTIMQGIWSFLLHRYTGSKDILYGVIVSGRPEELPGVEQRVGMYINTLPLHSIIEENQPITEWLQAIQNGQVSSRQYQYTPLQDIQRWTGVQGDLFDSLLVFENYPVSKVISSAQWSLQVENVQIQEQVNYPLSIRIAVGEEINISFSYNSGLLKKEYVQEISEHFEHVLWQILRNSEARLSAINLLTAREKKRLLKNFNGQEASYPDKTIAALFEEQVLKTPESVAIVYEEIELTYKTLNTRANQLAHYLLNKGVECETLIPICIERSAEMIVGILGIIKAGCAYVPIGPGYPVEPINYMLEDTGATLVLSSSLSKEKLNHAGGIQIIELDTIDFSDQSEHNPETGLSSSNLAYVIYTSGSTGRPKGVMIEHGSVANFLYTQGRYFNIGEDERILQFSNYTFDASVEQIFLALLNGSSLIMFAEGLQQDPRLFEDFLQEKAITHLHATPLFLENINGGSYKSLRRVIAGGDVCRKGLAARWKDKVKFYNKYGPTETTVTALEYHEISIQNNDHLPIGKPLSNVSVYIVDKVGQLLPIGVAGELWIGGVQVGRGYLNRPELSAEKFISNPFSLEGGRLYKTGDLCRWLPDGNIEFLGRIDHQVKIRGYRIELGEIESVLQEHPSVSQAVVLARKDAQGNNRLVGYTVPAEGSTFDKVEIQTYLSSRLPDYMIPQLWVELRELPLTSSGKADRKALPDPDVSDQLKDQYVAPVTESQISLARIWQQLLNVDQVGIHDNFFELGGHSLLAMRVISTVRRELDQELSIKSLFQYPTIALLSKHLEEQEQESVLPAIIVGPRPSLIPLSYSQERLWFIDQLGGSVHYHLPSVLRLSGKLDKGALSQSLASIIERHEVLRTVIREEEGQAYQNIRPGRQWSLRELAAPSWKEEELTSHISGEISLPFDLSKDYMLRALLISQAEEDHLLVVTIHHIASDAWSSSILVREMIELYSSYQEGRKPNLPTLPLQYADYSLWQRAYLQGEILASKLSYWKSKLDGLSVLQLPTDYVRPAVQSTRGDSFAFSIDQNLSASLQALSQAEGVTLYMTLLAAFKILLYRYSGQEDICVGSPVAGRSHHEIEGLIGFFVNTLALRTELSGDSSFTTVLQSVKETTLEAYNHQEVPFEKVVEAVVRERDPSRSPLFQVMLVLGNTPDIPDLRFSELNLSDYALEQTTVKFDLTFFISETNTGLQGMVQYSTDLYKTETIQRMTGHFMTLLESIAFFPKAEVGSIQMLGRSEQQTLLSGINTSNVIYPKEKTILDFFEEQALKSPDSVAVVFEGEKLTYRSLAVRSNQLAHYLLSKGAELESLIPICIERSTDMIVGILGIMKAGCAYVPIDTDYPQNRINYMLEDTKARIVVSSSTSSWKLPYAATLEVIELDGDRVTLRQQSTDRPQISAKASHLAYVIYTSGSTGMPKGVLVEHSQLLDYVFGLDARTGINNCSSFALVSTTATDLGNTMLFSWLVFGGALHIFSKETVSDAEALHNYFEEHDIDCLKIVPSHWKALSPDNSLVLPNRLLIFGGEALPVGIIESIRLSGSTCRIVNHYGPTETTIGKLLHEVDLEREYDQTIPIGTPFSNTRVYILSRDNSLCPIGVPGQLYIGGFGLARGYLNNEALSSEKFIPDPFNSQEPSLLYSTGDQVKYETDGNITFIGRVDNQVKIRGYRIEPGEIENTILQSGYVSQVVVLNHADKQGNNKLAGYIVTEAGFSREELMGYLKKMLPEYMIPSNIIELDALPRTANGKVDRHALPDPDSGSQAGESYTAPVTATQQQLSVIWADILEVDQVGLHDDFFELGGHSLLAVRLMSVIRKNFSAELAISDIFDYPTVGQLSAHLDQQQQEETLPGIKAVDPRPAQIPLSFSQERLWFIDQLGGSQQYHIPAVLRLQGNLNIRALEHALKGCIERHEILRTVVRQEEGQGYQYIQSAPEWQLAKTKGDNLTHEQLEAHIREQVTAPFNLSSDYMLRAELISQAAEEHLLVVTMHHIASDGWSRSVLVKEVAELYRSYVEGRPAGLAHLPVQYADYAIWQRSHLQGRILEKKLDYWKNKLSGVSPLQLPTDYSRPALQGRAGAMYHFQLDISLSSQLKDLSLSSGATLYMTLLSAFKVLLYRYSGQEDICVGSPVAGRSHLEIEGLIGFFVNTLALRSQLNSRMSYLELLESVKATTLEAYNHQEVPFERVVEAVVKDRDQSRSPLFQVMFLLQNTPEVPELRLGEVALRGEDTGHATSKFDLTFGAQETSDGLQCQVEYSTELYSLETISRMAGHFQRLLTSIVSHPGKAISDHIMLSPAEEKQLLQDFNATEAAYPQAATIVSLFEEQAGRSSGATAVVFEEETLSYEELNERSNQLARYLQKRGAGPETLVPVCLERSLNMIIGVLGILKAGAAYVPIDPEYPIDRISYMLKDSGAGIMLSSGTILKSLPLPEGMEAIDVEAAKEAIAQESTQDLPLAAQPHNLAYVIYTSGSTGKPKGVKMPVSSLVNLLWWQEQQFKTHSRRVLQFASITFDVSFQEIFSTLCFGSELYLIGADRRRDMSEIVKLIEKKAITHLFVPYIVLKNLAEYINQAGYRPVSLQQIIVAGEQLKLTNDIQDLGIKNGIRFINQYGPTEAHVVTSYVINNDDRSILPPIGRPIDNLNIHIINKDGKLVPIGVPGEICIGGAGLANGYLNREELTAEKFVENPFSSKPNARIYKTGDLGSWLPDGNIRYIGRIDEQVKIRGFRVELGEIESVLQEHDKIKQAVVIAKESTEGNKRLIAYVVPQDVYKKEDLVNYLKERLPEYMVPALWIELEHLPVTKNGKVDKRALPDIEFSNPLSDEYIAPQTETELTLAEMWKELLGVERVSVHDNFFEIGGHSLMVIKMVSHIKKEFELSIPISVLFKFTTIGELSKYLEWEKSTSQIEDTSSFEELDL